MTGIIKKKKKVDGMRELKKCFFEHARGGNGPLRRHQDEPWCFVLWGMKALQMVHTHAQRWRDDAAITQLFLFVCLFVVFVIHLLPRVKISASRLTNVAVAATALADH